MKKSFILLLMVTLFYAAPGQNTIVPTPTVTGPVTGPGTIFGASIADLSPFGYIEEEFFLEGKARCYDLKINPDNAKSIGFFFPESFFYYLNGIPGVATPGDTLYPYKTRIIVRRPAVPEKFNGTVVVEWFNEASMYDVDADWWLLQHYLMRSGYAWVGVSAEQLGIHSPKGLRKWNPARYGSLDVTAGSTLLQDQLCFDIFSQAVMALKGEQKVRPAEAEGHHPEITLTWGRVTVRLWTHKINGLHENDFILASKIDLLAAPAEVDR